MSSSHSDILARIVERLGVPHDTLAAFCRRHSITRLDAFGSVVRDDFTQASDVDLLATFAPGSTPTIFEHMDLESELERLIDRPVDILNMGAVLASDNELLREEVLSTLEPLYVEPSR
jgi:predicted nucleotidyltransferase